MTRMVSALFAALLGLSLSPAPARAQESPERRFERELVAVIKRVRPACVAIGGGSGVIISADGWVLTNHHVAGDAERVWTVRLPGGRLYDARIQGRDALGDISVLKIDTEDALPFLPLGDSDRAKVGEWVLAVGNPWGYAGDRALPTVSLGMIGALHRYQNEYGDAIQTDAPINPGNSGGALINLKGEIIGINGRIAFRFGKRSNTGVGFAIPSNQIKRFLPALKAAKGGRVDHGEVAGLVLDKGRAQPKGGALVASVIPKSPAAKAGLEAGDLIVAAAGYPVRHAFRLLGVLSTYPEGSELELELLRGGERRRLKVSLSAAKDGSGSVEGIPKPAPETPFIGLVPGMMNMNGLQIAGVWASSPADQAGVRAGDTLLRLNNLLVADGWDLESRLSGLSFNDKVHLTLERGGVELVIVITVGNSSHYPLDKLLTLPRDEGPKAAPKPGADLGMSFGDRGDEGVAVLSVRPGGPADKAGLKKGDEILSLNGVEAADFFALQEAIAELSAGQKVQLEVFRDSRLLDLTLVADALPEKEKAPKKGAGGPKGG